jgi:hypothetical protein
MTRITQPPRTGETIRQPHHHFHPHHGMALIGHWAVVAGEWLARPAPPHQPG